MNSPSVQDVITLIRQLERRVKDFPKSNWTAVADPTTNDDADKGYQVESFWYEPGSDSLWICKDATLGGAVWAAHKGAGAGPSQTLLSGLVSYWPLDDTGDVQHDVVGTNHLSDAQFNCLRPGKMGLAQSFEFEATSVAVMNPTGMNTRDWTIAGWFLATSGASPKIDAWPPGGQDGGLEIAAGHSSAVSVTIYDAAVVGQEVATPAGSIEAGKWHFVAVSKSGDKLNIQIDDTAPVSGTVPVCGAAFVSFDLGAYNSETADRPGIDELGFWNRGLSSTELSTLYNRGRGVTYPFAAPSLPGGYAGARLVSDGAELLAVRGSEGRIIFDDFEGGNLSGAFGAQGWATAVGGGGTVTQIAGTQDAIGVIRLSATSASAGAGIYSGSVSRNSRLFGSFRMIFRARVRLNQVANHLFQIGFQNAAGTNGAFFRFDSTSGHWFAITASGGTLTSIDTAWPSTASPGLWTVLEIDVSAAGNEAKFVVDGHPQATSTTNVPTAFGREFGVGAQLSYTAGAGGSVDIDWIELVTFAPVYSYGAPI